MVSCGAGEDISFDVAVASELGATVYIIDPTPRAVQHVRASQKRVGAAAIVAPSVRGPQDPASYDMSRITGGQIRLVPVAVGSQSGEARFYSPPDQESVSFSLVDFHNRGSRSGNFIVVQVLDLIELLRQIGTDDIDILKLDIEGSEIDVLETLIKSNFRPRQIVVEFEFLNRRTWQSTNECRRLIKRLKALGYSVVRVELPANITLVMDVS